MRGFAIVDRLEANSPGSGTLGVLGLQVGSCESFVRREEAVRSRVPKLSTGRAVKIQR